MEVSDQFVKALEAGEVKLTPSPELVSAVEADRRAAEIAALEVVMWTYRDGSIHAEMQLAAFRTDGVIGCHLVSGRSRFKAACGVGWFGIGSSSGLGDPARVSCPDCRELLTGLTMRVAS